MEKVLYSGEITSVTHDQRLDLYYANTIVELPDGRLKLESHLVSKEIAETIQHGLGGSSDPYFYTGTLPIHR